MAEKQNSQGSAIAFTEYGSREEVKALDAASVPVSSVGLAGWDGVLVEAGHNPPWEVRDLVIKGDYLSVNRGPDPLRLERKVRGRWQELACDPGTVWINPDGAPFSHNVPGHVSYLGVVLDPEHSERLLGRRLSLAVEYGEYDPLLRYLIEALAIEAALRRDDGRLIVEGLTLALVAHLSRRSGGPGTEARQESRSGLSAVALARVERHIQESLACDLTVRELARVAGVSAFHFTRRFKGSTGLTPHAYVVLRRVQRAQALLRSRRDLTVAAVASEVGFYDQSHLARHCRKLLGRSPERIRAEG